MWTKKQQVVLLSTAESELYAAVKTASQGLGIQWVVKDLGTVRGLNLHLDASATMCLLNHREFGKTKHVDTQNLGIQETSKSGKFVTKNVGTNVNPADLMTKPMPRPKTEQLINIMGCEFVEHCLKRAEVHGMRLVTNAKVKPANWAQHQQNELKELRSDAIGSGVEGRIWAACQEIALAVLKPHSA